MKYIELFEENQNKEDFNSELKDKLLNEFNWSMNPNGLEKLFTFKDFNSALIFVSSVGEIAEKKGHHPDIFLHEYNKVKITYFTHDKNQITEKDWESAMMTEDAYIEFG